MIEIEWNHKKKIIKKGNFVCTIVYILIDYFFYTIMNNLF